MMMRVDNSKFGFIYSSSSTLNGVAYPGSALALLPVSLSLCAIFCTKQDSHSVLKIVLPLPNVSVTVWKNHCPLSIFFPELKVTFVITAILITQLAFAFKDILGKITFVGPLGFSKIIDTCMGFNVKTKINLESDDLPYPSNTLSTKLPS